jgi:putative endonuclease
MSRAHELGRQAERAAAALLCRTGWTIVERNYRLGHKEIDLIARQGGVVAFIEVKCRSSREYGHPLTAITLAKRREIECVARAWIDRKGRKEEVYRFDAVAVFEAEDGLRVEHVPDAWRL